MKTRLPKSITRIDEAMLLIVALFNNGESFHPEDDATDLVGDLFTKEEGEKLNELMEQIYGLDGNFDPCELLVTLSNGDEVFAENSNRILVQTLTGAEYEITTQIDADGYVETAYTKKADGLYNGNFRGMKLGAISRIHLAECLLSGGHYYKKSYNWED